MIESEYDCCESEEDGNENINNTSKQQMAPSFLQPKSSCSEYIGSSTVTLTNRSSSDSKIFDGIIEAVNDWKEQAVIDSKASEEVEKPTLDMQSPENTEKTLPVDDVPNEENIKERKENNATVSRETLVKMRSRLNRTKAVDHNSDYSYKGVSERIQNLNKHCSLDSEHEKKIFHKSDSNTLPETKRISIDPEFEQKIKGLIYSTPVSFVSPSNNESVRRSDRETLRRMDSNSEVIEESLSPVSETAKQLEQQLSFTSYPKSPALSPRVPKLTRFARLNRFLSANSEPEDLSPVDTKETTLLNS